MIKTENVSFGGKTFKRTVSDSFFIRKIGTDEVYSEAYDLPNSGYVYEEINETLSASAEERGLP